MATKSSIRHLERDDTSEALETATPAQWFATMAIELWEHSAAAAMHRWASHEHHAGAPIQLTAKDYTAAIEAAKTGTPHPAAESKF